MFRLFKKKSKLDQLQDNYKCLIEQSYKLSTSNRSESDNRLAAAQKILEQIEVLQHV